MRAESLKQALSVEVVFEPMTGQDVPEVLDIERISFTNPWSEAMFRDELINPMSRSIVARRTGKIIGYIFTRLIMDEGHIMDVAVHPDFRGRGLGPCLVEESIGHLLSLGCRTVFLEVRISNEAAKKMYAQLGFEVIGRRHGYYLLPAEDAVVMAKRIVYG